MNNNSRTKNSILIMSSGMLQQIITVLFSFIFRTIFIRTLGENYLGINGLFTNILQIFSLAELGVGSAITFYMFKPIAEKDTERLKTLMSFYKICYRVIGFAILVIGLLMIPFLHKLVNFETNIDINLYVVYILYLLNSVATYLFFSYKFTIITAHQQGYVVNIINTIFTIISIILESAVLILFKAFILSLFIKLFVGLLKNLATAITADRLYPYLKDREHEKISKDEVRHIFKDIYSIFIFRISSTLFSSTDNIVISIMIGTVYVGFNSNYTMIIMSITNILITIIYSFNAGIGNINASESIEKRITTFRNLDFINFWLVSFCSISLFQLLNPFITLWIGSKYVFDLITVFFIVFNFFITYLLNIVFSFKDTMGLFKYGRYRQLAGGIANIILDIIFGKLWGLTGIFAATVISGLIFTAFIYPKYLYKYGFQKSPRCYYIRMASYYITVLIAGFVTWLSCMWIKEITYFTFIIEMVICMIVPNVVLFIFYHRTNEFKYFVEKVSVIIPKLKSKFIKG
jgi:O-antigen/teichoic acid export membrane protein